MTKKDCTNCKHAEWESSVSGWGQCTVEVHFPNSFINYKNEMPQRDMIWKHTRDKCWYWERVIKK